nr:Chain P, 10-meric peptide from Melanoma antigen recognized by T-cells 1 [Homo sapiens]3MRQ_P Chain P, 10-meric peptide from Melanoma antigen recognized by T-cells 1 [Homo sapiens]
ELAGLGINTV